MSKKKSSINGESKKDSTPKPKLKIPALNPCPICGGKAKLHQNEAWKPAVIYVSCRECFYGTINRRQRTGETRREIKVLSANDWNNGDIFPPEERKKLSAKAKKEYEKEKKAQKKRSASK